MADEERSPSLESIVDAAQRSPGPPPLRPFGLVLHHDGRWTHEGQPILNRKLREKFDVSVAYLSEEGKHVVRLGPFRGEIELEEAGFFVRDIELETGELRLSDGTAEPLDPSTLRTSPIDGAFLCRIKRNLRPEGLLARFTHAAQAELLSGVEEAGDGGAYLHTGGRRHRLPPL